MKIQLHCSVHHAQCNAHCVMLLGVLRAARHVRVACGVLGKAAAHGRLGATKNNGEEKRETSTFTDVGTHRCDWLFFV